MDLLELELLPDRCAPDAVLSATAAISAIAILMDDLDKVSFSLLEFHSYMLAWRFTLSMVTGGRFWWNRRVLNP